MASELLKNRALIQKLKEPEVPRVKFNLADAGFEELFTLPEPKPQELLDIQEDVRIQRKENTMNKARPFLMDESVDFIERENFSPGGTAASKTLSKIDALEKLILEYNNNPLILIDKTGKAKGENVISQMKVLQAAGFPQGFQSMSKTGPTRDLVKKKLKKLLSYQDKMEAYMNNVVLDDNAPAVKFTNIRDHITKKFGISYDSMLYRNFKNNSKAYQENKKIFQALSQPLSKNKILRLPDGTFRTMGDVAEKVLNKLPSSMGLFSTDVPERFILESAKRNFLQNKNLGQEAKVTFITNPEITPRTQWQFIHNDTGRLFSSEPYLDEVEFQGKKYKNNYLYVKDAAEKYPEFKGVYKMYNEDLPKYKKAKTASGKSLDQAIKMKNFEITKKENYKTRRGVDIDHRSLLTDPFGEKPDSLRLVDARVNRQAGMLKNYYTGKELEQKLIDIGYINSDKNVDDFINRINKELEQIGQKKPTAFQELISRKGSGVDPSLILKAGFEEFVKPTGKFASQVAKGAGTAADLAISAGKGGTGLALGALLEADPIITGMTEGKDFGQTARDTFVGTAIDAIPGVNLGSLNEDLIKLADTEEQRVGIQNLIDYQKDYDRFTKDLRAFKSYRGLDQISLDELGLTATDLVNMENQLAKRFEDIQTRAPKVYNPDVFSLVRDVAEKEAIKRKENLEGIQGLIFGDRMAKNPDFIENQIQQILAASTGVQGATDSYADAYKFLPQEQLTSDELDERFDMEGGIMAANGGRIGFADGPKDPKRRLFLKIMGGIASLPIFGKFLGKSEVAKPVVKLAGTTTKMPEWFPDFVNKMMFSTGGKKIDADLMEYTTPKLPGVKMTRSDDGQIVVEGKNAYGEPYEIVYRPPGYELVDETTGKAVKIPGEFIASDTQYRRTGPEMDDFDVDGVVVKDIDDILGGNATELEGFAKGTGETKYTRGQKEIDMADAEGTRADVDEGPDIDMSDYED